MGQGQSVPIIENVNTSFTDVTDTSNLANLFFMSGECAQAVNFFQRVSMWFVGYTKFICPWGIVVASTAAYPNSNLQFAANTLAELLDQNNDGSVDLPGLIPYLQKNWAAGGETKSAEDACSWSYSPGYCFGLQTWHEGIDQEVAKQIIREEIFHMVTQGGWAELFPDQMGANDFTTSIACREMARLQCVSPGWWHPENTCPSGAPFSSDNSVSSPLSGTCNGANCDCVEFFHQAVLLYNGQQPGWLSDYMPSTQADTQSMLSTEFKDMITNSAYGVPTTVLTGEYTVNIAY